MSELFPVRKHLTVMSVTSNETPEKRMCPGKVLDLKLIVSLKKESVGS